jgi:hypothetical protein
MKEFNVNAFLNDFLSANSSSALPLSLTPDIVLQADDASIVSSSKAFLRIVFDFLKVKNDYNDVNCYRDNFQVISYDSISGYGSDRIVMDEHGFMDAPSIGGGGITATAQGPTLEDAIQAVDPATGTYKYLVDEVLV